MWLALEARGELYTHDKFFKETQTNRIIHEAIERAYPVVQDTPGN